MEGIGKHQAGGTVNEALQIQENAGRKGDGLVVLLQDNAQKRLTIHSTNAIVANLLGYAEGELSGQALESILGQRVAGVLAEDLEYADDAPDVGELLGRQREFRLRHRLGHEIASPVTISRLMAQGQQACFQLVLPNEREARAQQQLKDFLKLNLEGRQLADDATGLPNRETAQTHLGLLKNYTAGNGMTAAFAVIRLDRHEKSLARYGAAACVELLKHAASICRSTFRTEDVICAMSDHTIGLILLDISRESARMVLNRLRWNIRNHRIVFGGKSDFSVTVSISFDMLDEHRGDTLLERCEESAAALDVDARNVLVELGQ